MKKYRKENSGIVNMDRPHDKFFKRMMGDGIVAKQFLTAYMNKDLMQSLDMNTLSAQKDSFVEENMYEVFSDLLYSVKVDGKESYIYFLFEHRFCFAKQVGGSRK